MRICRLLGLLTVLASSSTCGRTENPMVVTEVSSDCRVNQRLVRDICTRLGSDDGCVEVKDVCINLCDGALSCSRVDTRPRVLDPWAVAPNGYCVVCLDGK